MQEIVHPKGKVYYTMGEVAEMFDVKPSLLRYWEQNFSHLRPHRNKKGNRLYTTQDVDSLKIIYHLLKERGMKLDAARKFIKAEPSGAGRDAEIMERLLSIRSLLVEIKNNFSGGGKVVDDRFLYEHAADMSAELNSDDIPPEQRAVDSPTEEISDGLQAEQWSVVSPIEVISDGLQAEQWPVGLHEEQPPFEEQSLFELIPTREFESVDEAMDAFITKHYDAQADENMPSTDPFALFADEKEKGCQFPETDGERVKRPVIIEQTLF